MKNRIANDPRGFIPQDPPKPTGPSQLLLVAQRQLGRGLRRIETYVQENPALGIGTALCLGVVIGWISKRT